MKKLLLFLLLIPALISAQKVEYFPKRVNSWDTKTLRPTAFFAIYPDNNASKPWKLEIAIHGLGERGPGTLESLENLYLGPDYNNDGVREPGFVTDDMKRSVNLFGKVIIVPVYESSESSFSISKINEMYDWAQANFMLYPKMWLTGFSAGGGSALAYIKSNIENANRCAYVTLCASVNAGGDKTIPGKVGLPVHVYTNSDDPTVSKSNSQQIVADINATATLKSLYTEFKRSGHGSNIEAWSLTPPKAPGGQGFTDAAECSDQVFIDIIKTGVPRQMKSGAVIPPPDPIPVPTTKAIVKFTLTGSNLKLDGSGSTGWSDGLQGVWEYAGGPVQYSWDVFPKGSNYIIADAVLTKPGSYKFSFRLKGDPEIKTVTVDFGKVPVAFDSDTDLITYSDGSTEKGVAVYNAGKWVVKTAGGQIVNL